MEILNIIGVFSSCSSIAACLAVLVRLGEWKARHEERLAAQAKRVELIEEKQDELSHLMNKNNEILAEIKVKLDFLSKEKTKRSKG